MEGYALIHISSITYANAAKKILSEYKIYTQIQKAPAEVSKTGCGFCLNITHLNVKKAKDILLEKGFEIKGIYVVKNNGEIERLKF